MYNISFRLILVFKQLQSCSKAIIPSVKICLSVAIQDKCTAQNAYNYIIICMIPVDLMHCQQPPRFHSILPMVENNFLTNIVMTNC